MATTATGWFAQAGGGPLKKQEFALETPDGDAVLLAVSACGLCHTDLGYASGKVAPKHPLPLVLGHEAVGKVIQAGPAAQAWLGKQVLVPAVLPCGRCALCRAGRGNACTGQKMPGNDIHGGFASHMVVPSGSLIEVDASFSGKAFRTLGVVADAVSTAYQALKRAQISKGDLLVVIGSGGVGAFALQMAHAMGARAVALDVKQGRLDLVAKLGADQGIMVGADERAIKKQVQELARQWEVPPHGVKILECSGTSPGQSLAWALMGPASTVGFVGYTIDKVQVRLSNLMAFDATAFGSWGCAPEHYPDVLRMVKNGSVQIDPLVEEGPMDKINDYLNAMSDHRLERRMVLIPS